MTIDIPAFAGSYLTPSFEHARAADAMHPRLLTCTASEPLVDVARRMANAHVHAVVVLADDPQYAWAIVTDRDVLRCAERIEDLRAGDAPGSEPLTVAHDAPLADAAKAMVEHGSSHAVVVDAKTHTPIGMLSSLDIAGILAWGRG